MQEENFKILANGNKVTCAVIIQDSTGKILGCHPTGKKPGECYDLPKGCAFNPRCPYATEECRKEHIELKDIGGGHLCRCCRLAEIAKEKEARK